MARWDAGWIIWDTGTSWDVTKLPGGSGALVAANEVLEFSIPSSVLGTQKELFVRGSVMSSAHYLIRDSINDFSSTSRYRVRFP
jgi:hypothetical protein